MKRPYSYKLRIVFFFCYTMFFIFFTEINLGIIDSIYRSRKLTSFKMTNKQIFKIYCFGDSFTFGDGASPKDSYPRQLERMLNNDSRIKFQVFNLGIPGANSSQVLKYLQHILCKYAKPDLVILRVGVNDSWNFYDNNFALISEKENVIYLSKLYSILNNSRFYRLIKELGIILRKSTDYDPFGREENDPRFTGMDLDEFGKLAEFNLTEMVKLLQYKDIKIILQNYPGGDIHGSNAIANVAQKFSVPMVDVFSAFNEKLKELNREDIFAPYWEYSHPNAEGYKIMTEQVYQVIVKTDIVGTSYKLIER